MPIKPENLALYPANWKAIRAAMLERAGHRCEVCGVGNYAVGYWEGEGFVETAQAPAGRKRIRIVLTTMHLNHDPTDNRPENLKIACQRHHLRHDAEHHAKNAAATRRARKHAGGQAPLLEHERQALKEDVR